MLGPRIAALRREADMSQAALARHLQISPSAVGMYEQGRREPSLDTLIAMAELFHVSTDFLLTGKARTPEDEARLSRILEENLAILEPRGRLSRQELTVLMAAMLTEP